MTRTGAKNLRPQLLVSVRDADEAAAALAGGCDVVDVKEPARGSLGRADAAVLADVAARVQSVAPGRPVSAALGELREWTAETPPFVLPSGVVYAKLGLSGAAGVSDWPERWRGVRGVIDARAERPPMWVAVAYADWQAAEAPPPHEVVAVSAVESRCAAVLIDTYYKDGRTTLDHLTPAALRALSESVRAAGLRFALAGSLTATALPRLGDVPCDIIAVRTAACRDADRTGRVCPTATRRFADAVANVFDRP
jgi:uncharacterized protein (UPF0264 family)